MERVKIYLGILIILAVLGIGWGWFFGEDSGGEEEVDETNGDYENMEYDYGFEEEELEADEEDLEEEFDDYDQIYYDDEEFVNDEL